MTEFWPERPDQWVRIQELTFEAARDRNERLLVFTESVSPDNWDFQLSGQLQRVELDREFLWTGFEQAPQSDFWKLHRFSSAFGSHLVCLTLPERGMASILSGDTQVAHWGKGTEHLERLFAAPTNCSARLMIDCDGQRVEIYDSDPTASLREFVEETSKSHSKRYSGAGMSLRAKIIFGLIALVAFIRWLLSS